MTDNNLCWSHDTRVMANKQVHDAKVQQLPEGTPTLTHELEREPHTPHQYHSRHMGARRHTAAAVEALKEQSIEAGKIEVGLLKSKLYYKHT